MIKMKALRSFHGSEGKVRRGREFSTRTPARAKELETHGLAFRLAVKAEALPANKVEPPPSNKAAGAGPLGSPGGATGAEAPAPSSPPAPPRRRRRSRLSEQNTSADPQPVTVTPDLLS